MPKVVVGENGLFRLLNDSRKWNRLPPGTECWVEQTDETIVLLPRLPDIRKLYVEPTTDCNLNCRTCVRNAWQDPTAYMTRETFQRLMAQSESLPNLKTMIFGGIGEPLIHPEILDMIHLASERGLQITVTTNGLLLDRAMASELIKMKLKRIVVSLDGVNPDTYKHVRGTTISQVLENIRSFNDVRLSLGSLLPAVEIEFVALKSNVEELRDLPDLARQLAATRLLVSNVLAHTEEMREEVLYGYEPQTPLPANGWPVKLDAWVLWGTPDLPRMHWGAEQRCRFIQDKATVIGWDGSVVPCYALCHNYSYYAVDGKQKQVSRYPLGNINQRSLTEIWTSEDYCRFRNEVRNFNFPSCPDCDLRETCDLRERNEGCWGWNPSCADCLYAQDIVRCPGSGR